ncbi:MAG: hypothetical protein P9L94_20160 [Candidatus Hinthialibacter antarcticus]|nr:hypothetical protein [Candidatus Hinthialibacter antarcticus]
MDDIIQLIAIIVIIGVSAASSLVKNFNKDEDNDIDTMPVEPPKPVPSRPEPQRTPPRPQPQRSKPMASTDGRSLEGRSLEGRSLETQPQRRRKPIQPRRPQPAPRQRQAPQLEEVYVEPLPQKEEKKDLMTEIFKAFMEVEEPEIVMEPAPPKPKRAPKPQKRKAETKPAKKPPMTPARLAEITTPTHAHHPMFSQLAKQAEANPLRVAVVLSEILKRPRSLPPLMRWSDRN